MEPLPPAPAGPQMTDVRFVPDHTGIVVRDLAASVAFFRSAFGCAIDEVMTDVREQIANLISVPDAACDLTLLRVRGSGQRLELLQYTAGRGSGGREESLVTPGAGHVAFVVNSIADALAHLESHGARRIGLIVDYPDGPAAYCEEPGGAVLELMEVRTGN